jgi:hypothetical protein
MPFSLHTLESDKIRGRHPDLDWIPRPDSRENLLGRRTGDFSLEDFLDVLSERLAAQLRAPTKLAV